MKKYKLSKEEIFKYRPKPFYFLTTEKESEYTYAKVKKSLKNLKAYGFGGYILFNKPPKGFTEQTYLSDKWFAVVKTFAKVSKELGLAMWINDGFNFPPGNVAGRVEKLAPHLKQRSIYKDENGEIKIRQAEWGFPAFEEPLSGELFVKLVHEEYKKRVGEYFGNTIKGFFSDADNRRVLYTVMRDANSPMRNYFPWSIDFEKDFKKEYGYDIMPVIDDVIERKNSSVAVDYWEFAGRLYQRWFKNNYEWLKENGLEYTGHTGDTSPFLQVDVPRSSAFTEGRFSDLHDNFDYPGTDQELYAIDGGKHMRLESMYSPKYVWGEKEVQEKMTDFSLVKYDTRAKQAGSSAYVLKKKGAMSEMFAATNYGISPETLKQIAAFQIMQGVTFVVPHAYHYRFFGGTKYFAPPVFSEHSLLCYSNRQLNDEIAENCAMLDKGEKIYPIALVDPTERLWRNSFDCEKYFECFEKLNRKPQGFVICDINRICSGEFDFKVAVVAGWQLDKDSAEKLKANGVELITPETFDRIDDIIVCDVSWVGEGTPHFNRRIIDGEEFVFISNIEQTKPIYGTLRAFGHVIKTTLYPGDIKYISKNYTDIKRQKNNLEKVCSINGKVGVEFSSENVIPLERFESKGEVCTKTQAKVLNFSFKVLEGVGKAKLFIPKKANNRLIVFHNGNQLNSKRSKIFDEEYLAFETNELFGGEHLLTIHTEGLFNEYDRILLKGDFNVDVKTDESFYEKALSEYNMTLFIPKKAQVTLSKREKELSLNKSWAEQGQIFYSGKVKYTLSLPELTCGKYLLLIASARDVITLYVDGRKVDKKIKAPYDFSFEVRNKNPKVELEVINSYANELEGYAEESGILSRIDIYRVGV